MITALLVDDEPAAITSMQKMLHKYCPQINILGQAGDIVQATQKVVTLHPDLLFLDIKLPGGNGFDIIRKLPEDRRPEVIFATSYESYALRAIRVAALGYLVKPVDPKELIRAVAIAEQRILQKNSAARLDALLSNLDSETDEDQKVGIPIENGVDFVNAQHIIYCEGDQGYTRIHVEKQAERLSSYSIGEYRKSLEGFDFFAVHRSYLVNRQYVIRYLSEGKLLLANGKLIPVSRQRRKKVIAWLNHPGK